MAFKKFVLNDNSETEKIASEMKLKLKLDGKAK